MKIQITTNLLSCAPYSGKNQSGVYDPSIILGYRLKLLEFGENDGVKTADIIEVQTSDNSLNDVIKSLELFDCLEVVITLEEKSFKDNSYVQKKLLSIKKVVPDSSMTVLEIFTNKVL